ncbi:MAG: helix-turn-helix transcriptional regulator [Candidatus Izemoplasma sp.]
MQKEQVNQEKKLSEIIGKNIKSYRKALGFTQNDLAKFLKVSSPMITYFEQGTREVNMENLQTLADLFNIEFSDLLEENEHIINLNSAVAFKKDSLTKKDLSAIAEFRKIVKNYIKLSEE